MFLLGQLFPAVAVAAVVAAILSALVLRANGPRAARSLAAFALGTGYTAGHVFIAGWSPFPPTDTTNWLPYFALSVAAVGSLCSLLDSRSAWIAALGVICVGSMRLLLAPKFRYGWTAEQGWLWVGSLGCAALLLALSLETIARRSSTVSAIESTLIWTIVSAGTAGALMLSGSLLLGQFAAVLSAAVLGSGVLVWLGRIDRVGAASVFALVGVALLASGYFFAELPALSAVLLVTAPITQLIPIGISAPRWAAAARVAVAIAAVSGAIFAAFRSSPSWTE